MLETWRGFIVASSLWTTDLPPIGLLRLARACTGDTIRQASCVRCAAWAVAYGCGGVGGSSLLRLRYSDNSPVAHRSTAPTRIMPQTTAKVAIVAA